MTTYYFYSVILSNCLLLLAFIYGRCNKQLWSNKLIRWYIIYLGFILGIEIVVKILIYVFKSNNTQLMYPFYIAVEFFILMQLFLYEIRASAKWYKIVVLITSCIFIESMILWFINNDASIGFGKVFSHITIVCLTAYILVKTLKEFETINPFIIVYAALFLYYAVSLFLFLLMNQLTKSTIIIWTMNNVLSSLLYGSSIYTFYRLKKWY